VPTGFSLLDTLLVSMPLCLAILGFLRGGPAELISCIGCGAALVAAWLIGAIPALHSLGQPIDLLIAGMAGIAVWAVSGTVCRLLRLDTHALQWGHALDGVTGLTFGAFRGLVLVAAGCLFYAAALVPVGLADPAGSVVYPVLLQVASRLTQTPAASSLDLASGDLTSASPVSPGDGGPQPGAAPPAHWDPMVRDASLAVPSAAEPPRRPAPIQAMARHPPRMGHEAHHRRDTARESRPVREDLAARD
jgi:uncharacterized membrane protein required for colicin V production